MSAHADSNEAFRRLVEDVVLRGKFVDARSVARSLVVLMRVNGGVPPIPSRVMLMRSFITRALTILVISGAAATCTSAEPAPALSSASEGGGASMATDISGLMPSAAGAGNVNEVACTGAACACAEGQRSCAASLLGGEADRASCVDTSSDVGHCGGCGNVCAPGQVCFESVCSNECGGGLIQCGSSCVDVTTDPLNCGACGLQCGAGTCNAGACPAGKVCAVTTSVVQPLVADFESYTSGSPVDTFGFSFNASPGSPLAVYAGPYEYGDGTGAQALAMFPGNGSNFAVGIVNEGASAWGGALGFWMGCIDASSGSPPIAGR